MVGGGDGGGDSVGDDGACGCDCGFGGDDNCDKWEGRLLLVGQEAWEVKEGNWL